MIYRRERSLFHKDKEILKQLEYREGNPGNVSCPLCLCLCTEIIFEERFCAYYVCKRCDLRFLDPSFHLSAEQERTRYLQHNNNINDPRYQKFVKPLYDQIVEHVPRNSVGLDFGAGTGPVLADMLRQAGYEIRLFDPFFHPDNTCLEQKYGFIFACEVVEHLFKPREEFQRLRALIDDGGLLSIMTLLWTEELDFAGWHYRKDNSHVAFYSQPVFRWIQEYYQFQSVVFPANRVVLLWT